MFPEFSNALFAIFLSQSTGPVLEEGSDPSADRGGLRPNIVLMVADDQGWAGTSVPMHPSLGGSASTQIRTPHLEVLASEGMRFSQAYASAPVCLPSRASIQTGRNPAALRGDGGKRNARSGGDRALLTPSTDYALPESEVTLGEWLGRSGYRTAHFGKWHLSGGGPGAHGYDVHDGDTNNREASKFKDPNPADIFGMVARAEAFMSEAQEAERPFFVQLSFLALHAPENARAATIESLAERGPWRNPRALERAAMAEDLDTGVGRLLAAIEHLGLGGTTYVIYTSDNGQTGQRGRGALNGGKGVLLEGGLRVPFILRGPDVEPDTWCHVPVVGYDFLPTFVEWAGGELPDPPEDPARRLEGTSFAPLITNPRVAPKRPTPGLVFHHPQYQSGASPQSSIRMGDHKLILEYEGDRVALYDLAADPGERVDLVSESAEPSEEMLDRAVRMRGVLIGHLERLQAELPVPRSDTEPSEADTEPSGGDRRTRRGRRGDRGPRRDSTDPGGGGS